MKQKAFTVLELVVVVIIVGLLSSLALPRLLSLVESSRSVEAVSMIKTVQQSVTRCGYMCISSGKTFDACDCGKFDTLDVDNPNGLPNSHFDYSITDETAFGDTGFKFSVVAKRNTQGGYVPESDDLIKFTQCPMCGDAVAIRGWGVYENVNIGDWWKVSQ